MASARLRAVVTLDNDKIDIAFAQPFYPRR